MSPPKREADSGVGEWMKLKQLERLDQAVTAIHPPLKCMTNSFPS